MIHDLLLVVVGLLLGIGFVLVPLLVVISRLVPRLEVHSLRAAIDLVRRDIFGGGLNTPRGLERVIANRVKQQRITFSSGRVFAMGSIIVWLSEFDQRLLLSNVPERLLVAELQRVYRAQAVKEGWILPTDGPIIVKIASNRRLTRGVIDVDGRLGGAYRGGDSTEGHPGHDSATQQDQGATTPYPPAGAESAATATTTPLAPSTCTALLTYGESRVALTAADPPASIGRASDSTIRLEGVGVSRHHATIEHRSMGWVIKPRLEARNGTFLDGVRISSPVVLPPHSVLRLGSSSGVDLTIRCKHLP